MSFKVIINAIKLSTILGLVATHSYGSTAPSYNRGISRWDSAKATIARSTEIDPCSSRNVAENIRYFFKCLQTKMSDFVTTTNNAPAWDPSKVWSVNNGSIQTTTIPYTKYNKSLFTQWNKIYQDYNSLMDEKRSLVGQMIDMSDDTDETQQQVSDIESKIASVDQRLQAQTTIWQKFTQNNPSLNPAPTTLYPTLPDPMSTYFLSSTTQSGAYMISEDFYAALRAVLDQNPNMHLQLMKYYLLQTAALFSNMTRPQTYIARTNKIFRLSLMCADLTSIEGAILSIAAGVSPPLLYVPLQACQFTAQRVGPKSDGSQVTGTGTYSSGAGGYAF